MEKVDTRAFAAGKKTAVSYRTDPACAALRRLTPGTSNRRRLVDRIAAFFGRNTSDPAPHAGNTLGKYEPFLTCYCAAIIVFSVLATAGGAHAGDKGHRLGAPADIKSWIDGLANRNGANCCSDADGVKPQEVAWEIGKSQYRVRVRDQWIDVPEDAVIQGPNYLGHAVVWLYEELLLDDAYEDIPYVRCFLPGPAG